MPPAPVLLEVENVGRHRGGRAVLRGISFALHRGEVLGLLGVNGAGKSTTLAIIAGVLAPDAGQVRLDGHIVADSPAEVRRRVGWVPESVALWPELTVTEALDACGRLRGLAPAPRKVAIERELARLDLGAAANRTCGRLSLGQKRRVGLAQAMLHDPDLLVLDEPGNGLDPVQAARLQALLAELSRGRGIILSTHDLAEVETVCNRVVILHDGTLRHDAPLERGRGDLEARFRAIARAPAGVAA